METFSPIQESTRVYRPEGDTQIFREVIQKTAHRFQEDSEGRGRGIGKPSFCGQPKGKGNGGKSKNNHQMNKRIMKTEAMELKGEECFQKLRKLFKT